MDINEKIPDNRRKFGRGSKSRGRGNRGARGGGLGAGRGGKIKNSHNQKLESNEWRFTEESQESDMTSLRKATLDNCFRLLPKPISSFNENIANVGFSSEEIKRISALVSQLPIEDQINYDFIVPMPPLDSINLKNNTNSKSDKETAPSIQQPKKTEENNKTENKNLDEWLDGLLG